MQMDFLTRDASQTKTVAKILAKEVLKTELGNTAIIIGLVGDLGGGKTTFVQGFAQGLGIKGKILSPTFVILRRMKIQNPRLAGRQARSKFQNFYHIDCYRIEKPKELLGLGFKEIIADPRNVVAVEWADKIKGLLPKNHLSVKFDFVDKNTRKITLWTKKN